MKKICYITTTAATLGFVLKSSKYIHEKGKIKIYMISNRDEKFQKDKQSYINYIPVSMKRGIDLSALKSIVELYKIFKKEKFDMIQYSTPNASLYASIAGRLAGIKVRLYCQWGIRYVGFIGIKRNIFKIIEKIICKNSTWIEPDSYGNLEFSRKEKLYNEDKSSVVWNGSAAGVDLDKFNVNNKDLWRKEIREKYKIKDEEIVLGFVGRLDKDKGVNELFEAFKLFIEKNKQIKLLFVGNADKPETIDNKLYEWAKQSKQVAFTGGVTEIEKYYAAMDIFTLPSYREGFGSVVIEAEAMKVPVIVTNIPGPRDAMINKQTGLMVEKENSIDLKNAIEKLADNKDLREKMGNKGFEFSIEKFEDKKLFEYILEDRKRLINI